MTTFLPRPSQQQVLDYTSGKMGISAVPGSGKTHTLAVLAAQLVAERIADDQEVLIVTLVNTAVDNFKKRINAIIAQRRLLPNFGYRVRTLHGLSHDIVRERPGLVGLSEDFGIIDERAANTVREDAVDAWLHAHPGSADPYLAYDLEADQAEWVKRSHWPALVRDVATAFIKRAKDLQLSPQVLLERLVLWEEHAGRAGGEGTVPAAALARMGAEIYADYQRSLAYRGVVDFDDLIRLALEALRRDPDYLARLRHRWPYILEDEAQDSSQLQEQILRLLVGDEGNWVRVGDPNQAIYETFTTADPRFLRDFLNEGGVTAVTLPESGRSQPAIISLANHLVDAIHENEGLDRRVREAFVRQHIEPTGPGDPQPNPPAHLDAVQLLNKGHSPQAELEAVVDSLERWLPGHEDQTVAVLVPRNQRGFDLTDRLKQREIPHVELLRSTSTTRDTAGVLGNLLRCLADPTSPRRLSVAFRVWRRDDRDDPELAALMDAAARRIARCPAVEAYLWPGADHDWLERQSPDLPADERSLLVEFRPMARRWHRASDLPIDQLILTLVSDLFQEPAELALAHKLALLLRDVARAHPAYRLAELVEELAVIARNERRFLGFSGEDTGFRPSPGTVTVATMHKAKGLEWDRVYLVSVNNYNFPFGLAHDTYIAERWFVRDRLNLEAEALAQLEALADPDSSGTGHFEPEGSATEEARLDYVAERLRLLYVGITRARRELIITWNTGRRREAPLQMAAPLYALQQHLAARLAEARQRGEA